MTCSKLRFGFLKDSLAKPRLRQFRPQVEALENRLQPSLMGVSLDAIEAHPITGFHHIEFALQSTAANGVSDMLALNTATYLTGTTGAGTARGIALGQDGTTYETGTITVNGSAKGYVAKYSSSGTQVYFTTFQAMDFTAPDFTFTNTEGHAIAVDSIGQAYVTGTAIDASSGDHNAYTMKFSADGTTVLWGNAFDGPGNLTTGDGIAVLDPNNDGNGHAIATGTFTNADTSVAPAGDYVTLTRWTVDGTNADYSFFYAFTSASATHGKAVALNTNSTVSTPGSLAYIAGNITIGGEQDTLAFQLNSTTGNGKWGARLTDPGSTSDTLTGVAVNPDDTSVYSGTLTNGSSTGGVVTGYAADGGGGQTLFQAGLGDALSANAVTVDSAGNIYVTGAAANPSTGGVIIASLNNTASMLLSELQFGGTGTVDAGYGIVVTTSGSLWVVGDTTSSSLSTDGSTLNGTQDGFLASVGP
jgi:hypothetical protein